MTIFDGFMLRALLAGLGTALAAAPLGCFVVWRRMAYFGDATGHAAILGVALALALSLPVTLGVLVAAVAMALAVARLGRPGQGADTLLGVLSHGALAAGLVAASLLTGVRVDLQAFLFGDILAVSWADVATIWTGAVLVALLIGWQWRALLTATLSEDLARAAGIDPRRAQLVLTLALAVVVALAIKVVGALLITAMLVIPAAAARHLATSPERMALGAALAGAASVAGGLQAALIADSPAGPSIVCAAVAIFAVASLARSLRGGA